MKIQRSYLALGLIAVLILSFVALSSIPAVKADFGDTPHAPIYIDGNSQFTSANGVTSGSGTSTDPWIIENYAIDASAANGISIQNTTAYFVVRNCLVENGGSAYYGIYLDNMINGAIDNNTCSNNLFGISLETSSNNTLTNNTCGNNSSFGIYLESSSNNNLTNNTCENNSYAGIYLNSSSNNTLTNTCGNNSSFGIYLTSSSNDNLTNNTCGNNSSFGIYLDSSSNNNLTNNTCSYNIGEGIYLLISSNNTLTNNTCSNNTDTGIYLEVSSDYNTLDNNTCLNNTNIGIYLDSSSNNNLTGNTCDNNLDGIYLTGSSGNIIYLNHLDNNTDNNAYDDDTSYTNAWNNGSAGNYWSDWQPPAHPSANGIYTDDPRPILGGANQDSYPMVIGGGTTTTTTTTPTTTSTTTTTTAPPTTMGVQDVLIFILPFILIVLALTFDSPVLAFFGGTAAIFAGLYFISSTFWMALIYIGIGLFFILTAIFSDWEGGGG